MRLTLRTLLAYLDDILPPAEAKELGEKIAASPIASQYVDRVRDVMRRRRLMAPEPDGSGGGIEPNLVAEYLDNSLAPEKVADVERVCLESDVNLAEVAACHQILTLVLGEPVEISGRLRERMYALGPQGATLDGHETPPPPNRSTGETTAREQLAAIQAAQRPKPVPATRSLESRLPEYLRQKPLWKRMLPWAAIAAVVAVWLGLLAYDPTFFGGRRTEDAASPQAGDQEGTPVAGAETPAKESREPVEAETKPADDAATAVITSTDLAELPVDPAPPADDVPIVEDDAAEATVSTGRREMTTGEAAVAAASTGEAAPDSMPEEISEAPKPMPASPPAGDPAVDIASSTGIVLRFDAPSKQWYPLAAEEDPRAGVAVAVPEPFEAQIEVAALPLRVDVLGGTRLTAFGATDAGPVGFDIAQGRLRLSADSAQMPDVAAMMFAVRLGRALWRVEPLTPETRLGIESLPLQPTGMGQDLSGRTPQGVIYVATGAVRVADASGRVEVASAGNRLILTPDGTGSIGTPPGPGEPPGIVAPPAETSPAAAVDATETTAEPVAESEVDSADPPAETAPAEESPPSERAATDAVLADEGAAAPADAATSAVLPTGVPDWMTPREPTSAARRAMVAFQKEFVPGASAGQSLLPAVDSPLFFVAEPATKALGLIEDVDGMVKALRDTEHPEAVRAAIEGLRNWLGRSPDHGEALVEQLNLVFAREGLSTSIEQLLWGYDLEDARDETTARQLVDWLDHREPVVRELAFYHVSRLSGRTLFYRPNQNPNDRAGAVNRWRDFVNRNGGLVIGQ